MLQFKVLGTLEVFHDGRMCTPTPPKVRRVLALLLLRANQVVHIDAIIDELWGDRPPRSAVTTAQTYIYQLRKHFVAAGLPDPTESWLITKQPGYLLRLHEEQLDANVFQRRSWQGRRLMERGEAGEASEVLREALALWSGPALTDVALGRLLESHAVHLDEQRLRALELRLQADVELGRDRELIGELRELASVHPLNEWIHGQLISSLSRCGRRSEALQVYAKVRDVLASQLGLDPSPELQRLQHDVLSATPPRFPVPRHALVSAEAPAA